MIAPFAFFEMWLHGLPTFTVKGTFSFLFLVLGCTIMAYALWNKALETIPASKAGIYLNAIPLCNVCTAILLLDESISWRTLVGGALVLGGVLWAERRKHPLTTVATLDQ